MTENTEIDGHLIASIYAEKIRTLRTRSYSLEIPERENDSQILHTLLGIELKVGRRRFACPDLSTARYMRVFARLGCRQFAVPYDITTISTLADDLETAWQRTLLKFESESTGLSEIQRKRKRSRLVGSIRAAIDEIGPGERMPEFSQSTRQRNT
jgi:hypothetical protein